MCGIVGVIEKENATEKVLQGLEKLQYRGYDSAGICFKSEEKLNVIKSLGTIDFLREKVPKNKSNVAIGHTRWATHGKVCETNAHPILSENKNWAVVHNGIIENYKYICDDLQEKGVHFSTQTDTETISALLGQNNFLNPIKNIAFLMQQIKGSYAFCAVKNDDKQQIFAAKNKSPLYVFCSPYISMLASDPICFPKGEYFKMEDGEICKLQIGKVEFFDCKCQQIKKQPNLEQQFDAAEDIGQFDHYMLKEIYQTSPALRRLAINFLNLDLSALKKLSFDKVKLVGCGSAYHSCMIGCEYFKKVLKVDSEALQASEFRYGSTLLTKKTLCIFVSQSGETADTIAAAEFASKKTKNIVVLTNVLHSTLAKLGKIILPISAGVEMAVASTKAYSCQVAALYLLVMTLKSEKMFYKAVSDVFLLSKKLDKFYINMAEFAQEISFAQSVFFIGKGLDYVTAMEGALKLKEISYINCNAYPAGELKHGILTLIEKDVPLIVVATQPKIYEKTMNSALEAKSRGAKLFLISASPPKAFELEDFEMCLSLPKCPPLLRPILAILPLQKLSYLVSIQRGNNPDMPRNLAKSVTVE